MCKKPLYGGSPFVRQSMKLKLAGELCRGGRRVALIRFDLKDLESPLKFFCFLPDLMEFVDGKRFKVLIFLDDRDSIKA
jgi:hypothetical protein